MANCSLCGKPVKCEVVYHAACLETKVNRLVSAATSWIPTSERLPQDDDLYLVLATGIPRKNVLLIDSYELAEYSVKEGWIFDRWPEWEGAKVTYWMPLPEPPVSVDA